MTMSIAASARETCLVFGIGLENVLALDIEALEGAVDRRIEHVRGCAGPGSGSSSTPHSFSKPYGLRRSRCGGSRGTRAGTSPCRRSPGHCSGRAAGSRRRRGRDCRSPWRDWRCHDGRRTLAVLGDAEAVVDRRVAAGGVETRGRAHHLCRNAGEVFGRLGAVAFLGDEGRPVLIFVPVAARARRSR